MRNVQLLGRFSHFYMVGEGLQDGERIVYEGIQTLREGVVVKPVQISMDSLIQQTPNAQLYF